MELSSQVPSYNSALRVFGIPELAKLICELIPRRDNASLLCVCHQLFRDVRPFAWERTDAVETLVRMIPETRVGAYIDEPFPSYITMYLPKSIDLSRLSFYSPYIKYLEIPLTTAANAYENWDEFLASTRTIDLLPNLEHLKLAVPCRTCGETIPAESLKWTIAFLSSSLLSVQIYPDVAWDGPIQKFIHAWVNLDYAIELLQNLSEKCHRLSSLMILAGDITTRASKTDVHPRLGEIVEVVPTRAIFWRPPLKIGSIFACFNSLRKLSATPLILYSPAFRALSKLPCLESLSIRDLKPGNDWRNYYYTPDLDVTENTFPALQRLDLIDLTYGTIINICGHRSLVQALHSLRPTVALRSSHQNELAELLRILAEHDSPVCELCLPFIPTRWKIFPQSADHISCLKLTHLSLPQPRGSNYQLIQLAHVVPALKSLEFNFWESRGGIPLGMLLEIATLFPNLSRLSAPLNFYSAERLEEQNLVSRGTPSSEPFCLESYFYGEVEFLGANRTRHSASLTKYTERIARYFYALWPNIECTTKRLPADFEDPPELIRINNILCQLRSEPSGV